jgi:hypothetical protein
MKIVSPLQLPIAFTPVGCTEGKIVVYVNNAFTPTTGTVIDSNVTIWQQGQADCTEFKPIWETILF